MLRNSLDELYTDGLIGDWIILEGKDGLHIWLRYPCKVQTLCGDDVHGGIVHLPIRVGESLASPMCWAWNGNKESPTLTPSILINGGDGHGGRVEYWHGFLTDGKLVTV